MAPEHARQIGELIDLLDAADDFSRAEQLLTAPRTPDQRSFQIWFLSEFRRQAAGAPPEPWSRLERRGLYDRLVILPPRLLLAVSAGGAVGAVLRYLLGVGVPDGDGIPVDDVRDQRRRLRAARRPRAAPPRAAVGDLGRGARPRRARRLHHVLGDLASRAGHCSSTDDTALALVYLVGTFAACLVAVLVVGRFSPPLPEEDEL